MLRTLCTLPLDPPLLSLELTGMVCILGDFFVHISTTLFFFKRNFRPYNGIATHLAVIFVASAFAALRLDYLLLHFPRDGSLSG